MVNSACCVTLQSHKQSLQRKLQERKAELESKQEQLASTLQESDAMRAVIAGQTVNKDDVVRMNQEKCAMSLCPHTCLTSHCFSMCFCREGGGWRREANRMEEWARVRLEMGEGGGGGPGRSE